MAFTKLIAFVLDGTINSYKSCWQGADKMPDPPVPGMFQLLEDLTAGQRFRVAIVSFRFKETKGVDAVKDWLKKHGLCADACAKLELYSDPPPAWVTIDARALPFNGIPPSPWMLDDFKPWNVISPAERAIRHLHLFGDLINADILQEKDPERQKIKKGLLQDAFSIYFRYKELEKMS